MFEDNPYQSPSEFEKFDQLEFIEGEIQPVRFDLGQVMRDATEVFKEQLGMSVVVSLLFIIYLILIGLPGQIPNVLVQMRMIGEIEAYILAQGWSMFSQIITLWFQIGLTIFFLKMARGEQVDIMDLFRGGYCYLSALGAWLIVTVVTLFSMAILWGPGILLMINDPQNIVGPLALLGGIGFWFVLLMYAYVRLWPYWFFLVDRRMRMMDSFTAALDYTSDNQVNGLVVMLLFALAIIVGFIMCCVGVIFTLPWGILLCTMAYLAMTNQPNMLQHPIGKS